MSGIVPTVGLTEDLNKLLNQTLTLKLYSNNVVPSASDTYATYTEVAGGGYASKSLVLADWSVVAGVATGPQKEFDFTGVTNAPGVIYGYYIINGSNVLIGAERFPNGVLPFTPIDGSFVKITPVITAAS